MKASLSSFRSDPFYSIPFGLVLATAISCLTNVFFDIYGASFFDLLFIILIIEDDFSLQLFVSEQFRNSFGMLKGASRTPSPRDEVKTAARKSTIKFCLCNIITPNTNHTIQMGGKKTTTI